MLHTLGINCKVNKTRDNRKDSQGYYLFGVEGNILQKINFIL